MAQLPAAVVVHGADKDNLLLKNRVVPVMAHSESPRFQKPAQALLVFDELGHILSLHAEHRGVPLRQHFGLVFTQVCGDKVLPDKVFLLHHIAVADDEPHGPVQCVEQPVQMGRDMAPCAPGAQHDHFHGSHQGKLHPSTASGSPRSKSLQWGRRRTFSDGSSTPHRSTWSSHSVGNSSPTPSSTSDGSIS